MDRNQPLTVLFTCVGRRVELVQAFRAAGRALQLDLRIIGTDIDATAPALSCVDVPVIVPRVADPAYIPTLLDLVGDRRPDLLIPTIDTDLLPISRQRDEFDAAGCRALIAAPPVIEICRDKALTFRHLVDHGIDCPATWTPEELRGITPRFPLFMKPRGGSASQSIHKIEDQAELDFYLGRVREPIIQEFVSGTEFTLDVYVGLTGEPRCVVPRQRWQVRTGEVVKGVVVKDCDIMEAGRRVAESLGRSARGLITLQCIVSPDRRIRFIEINPRFGGGAPMSIAAGADFPRWVFQEALGQKPAIAFDGFTHGLCMLRYDWSVFVRLQDDLVPRLAAPQRAAPDFG